MIKRALVLAVAVTAFGCKKEGKVDPATSTGAGSGGSGSAKADPGPPPPVAPAITKPFFYEVSKDGKTSWLFGTLHAGVDARKQLPKVIWERLAQARTFIAEADITDPMAMFKLMMRSDGTTLDVELGPEYWAKFEVAVGDVVAVGMKGMKTGMSVATLQAKELPPTEPMDTVLHGKAVDDKKEIVWLESAASQLAILDKWLDVRMLKWMLDNPRKISESMAELHAAYVAGDDAVMVEMFGDKEAWHEVGRTDAELDLFLDEILYKRNAAWIPKLEEKLSSGSVFVAVGAGHLVGPKSVNELLTAKGWQVKRVEP